MKQEESELGGHPKFTSLPYQSDKLGVRSFLVPQHATEIAELIFALMHMAKTDFFGELYALPASKNIQGPSNACGYVFVFLRSHPKHVVLLLRESETALLQAAEQSKMRVFPLALSEGSAWIFNTLYGVPQIRGQLLELTLCVLSVSTNTHLLP